MKPRIHQAPQRPARWTRLGVPWIGGALIGAIVVMAAYDIARGYRDAESDVGRELSSQARIVAEQTARSLQAVDVVLRHFVAQFRQGTFGALDERQLHAYLREQAVGLVQIDGLAVRDAQGDLLGASWSTPTRESAPNIVGQGFFRALRDSVTSELYIGDALHNRMSGRWVFPIARRLEAADGTFAGTVGGLGRIEYYQDFYRDIQLDAGTKTTLMHRDGTLLARYPAVESALGQRFPLFDQMLASKAAGEPAPTRTVSPIDGIERFGAIAEVPDYPVVVLVTRDVATALASWRTQAIGTAIRTLALALLAALLLALLMRQLSRLAAARASLETAQERYQLAMTGSNQGLWDWDLVSDTLFLSPRAQASMGLEPGEPQRPRREWIERCTYHPDDVDRVREAISSHLRGATGYFEVDFRLRHRHSDTWHWYRQRGIALRDEHGRAHRMAGSFEDVTDRRIAEEERDRLESRLRQAQKLEAIGTLAGGIAHDFNNILAAILGYGEMARKGSAEGTALRRHIDAALSAGMRAKSLVERILAFGRSGTGKRVLVPVQAVVGEALDVVTASLPNGVRLQRELAGEDAAILGDPTQVHQVVMNLCANAVAAMKGGGTITITLDRTELGDTTVATSVLPQGRYVRLQVRDTGTGIAPDILERIFDPFFTTKEVGVGTGLGLSLVHGIVADLGGGIDVASRLGDGATFTVYLPWRPVVALAVPPDEEIARGAGETILLVDDEESLVRLGEEMIAELGYEPVGFASSAAALRAFRAQPDRFDAVLSDESMPDMSGSELAREIRRLRPDIPIVLMSGYVTPALSERAREAGVADVLSKPLSERDIARSLAAVLLAKGRTLAGQR